MISVVIPVGPNLAYRQWLGEAIESVKNQTLLPTEILIVDDMAFLKQEDVPGCSLLKNDWLLGCAGSWNRGVALSSSELVFLMGSDDKLMPTCLEDCFNAYTENKCNPGWYAVTYQLDNGTIGDIPINAAAVTKSLWAYTGGFPPSAFAGPDALVLSCLMKHKPEYIIKVKTGKPNYWIRSHPDQDTHRQASFFLEEMNSIRNKETARFKPSEWGKKWYG